MGADPDSALAASLLAEPALAAVLARLMDGRRKAPGMETLGAPNWYGGCALIDTESATGLWSFDCEPILDSGTGWRSSMGQ